MIMSSIITAQVGPLKPLKRLAGNNAIEQDGAATRPSMLLCGAANPGYDTLVSDVGIEALA